MGLDISFYSGLKRVEPQPDCEDTPDGMARIYVNPDFPERADGLQDGYYTFDQDDGFAAGSYSGYGIWREQLAELAGYPAVEHRSRWDPKPRMLHAASCWQGATGPFSELIHMADNEGTIGEVTAAKLARDFAENQAKADQHYDSWFRRRYADWRRAFELAANAGAVSFH